MSDIILIFKKRTPPEEPPHYKANLSKKKLVPDLEMSS